MPTKGDDCSWATTTKHRGQQILGFKGTMKGRKFLKNYFWEVELFGHWRPNILIRFRSVLGANLSCSSAPLTPSISQLLEARTRRICCRSKSINPDRGLPASAVLWGTKGRSSAHKLFWWVRNTGFLPTYYNSALWALIEINSYVCPDLTHNVEPAFSYDR